MLAWNLSKENDLILTKTGQISMVNKLEALRVALDSALQVVKGELDNENLGVDYFGIILSDTPLSMKVQELTRVLMQNEEVQDVKFLRAEINKKENKLTFYFDIESVYGQMAYDNSFEII
jgi:hypothetical protein